MVNKYIRDGAIAALAALSSAAFAGPTSEWRYLGEFQSSLSAPGLSPTPFQNAAGLATHFDVIGSGDTSSRANAASASFTLDSQATQAVAASADAAASSERRRALSATTDSVSTSSSLGSTAVLQLTLWNFINNVRAQQTGNEFQSLMASAANIDYTINGLPPSPTPLPETSWLFLCGLTIFAAIQWRVRRGARAAAHHQIKASA
jgi:hypothetical protein